jgi:hypothetical protein
LHFPSRDSCHRRGIPPRQLAEEEIGMRTKAIFFVALGLALLASLGMGSTAQAQTCGGIGGLKCPSADQVCKYPVGKCNVADLAGTCVTSPKECPKKGPKVCGCDDKTYANECELLKAGVKEAKKGACTTAAKPKPASSQKSASAKSR